MVDNKKTSGYEAWKKQREEQAPAGKTEGYRKWKDQRTRELVDSKPQRRAEAEARREEQRRQQAAREAQRKQETIARIRQRADAEQARLRAEKEGLAKYEADRKVAALAEQEKPWWQKMAEDTVDNEFRLLPGVNVHGIARDFERDTSYQEMDDRWDEEHRQEFGYWYAQDPEAARDYAAEYNDYLNRLEKQKKMEALGQEAVDKPWLSTAKAIGAQALGGFGEYVNDVAENLGRGRITERGTRLSPTEYAGTVTGAISEDLNRKHGTIDGSVYEKYRMDDQALRDAGIDPTVHRFATDVLGRQVLDGKGWGDAYQLGTSAAQSMMWAPAAKVGGAAGQLMSMVSYFGQAAASGVDDARARGGSDEQALIYGALMGLAETAAEQIDIRQLNALGNAVDMSELLTNMAKQGISEALEEGVTSVVGTFADELVMQDKSQRNLRILEYMENGMTEEEANRQAWNDAVNDALESVLGGFISGSATGGATTAKNSAITNLRYGNATLDNMMALVQEGMAAPEGSAARTMAQEYEQQLFHGRELNGVQIQRLLQELDAQEYSGTEQALEEGLMEEPEATDIRGDPAAQEVTEEPVATVRESRMVEDDFAADTDVGDMEEDVLASLSDLGLHEEEARVLRENFRDSGMDPGEYAIGVRTAFQYGQMGIPARELARSDSAAGNLAEYQRITAYKYGRLHGDEKAAQEQAALKNKIPMAQPQNMPAPENLQGGTGVFYDAGGGRVTALGEDQLKELTGKRKAGVEAAILLKKLGFGNNYYFFESYENADGKRVFLDEYGAELAAPNGWYSKGDGSIHIDLNAGTDADGLTLYTLSHELTHFVENWSQVKYRQLAEFLAGSHGENGSVDELVTIKQAELSESRNSDVSYEEAYSEFIADSMEGMLADGNVLEKLTEMKKADQGLFDKIREFFSDLVKRITEFYKGVEPNSEEGQAVLKMKDRVEQIQQLFAEALAEADENYRAAAEIGLEVDTETESVAPAVLYSERTWRESDYVQERKKATAEIRKAIGVPLKKAEAYIDSVNSIAKMIAEDRTRLDYFSSPGRSSFVGNVEYGGSFDFSTLCKKRRLLTGTFRAIQKALPNTALTANEILDIRNRMKEAGLEVSCGLCYVEGSRANMGQFAKEFLRLYKQYYPDAWQPNMADVNTPDGIEWVRINHPECYEQYEYFWNHYGTLKPGDKNLFASQQKPKLYQLHTEYKGEILQKFKDDGNVEDKNLNGGIRLQSFSDFEIVHLIDTMQIVMDMSRVGLAGQAYTKVPDFAWALGDTGLKINLSLIAKGVDADGELIFDDVEGMPIAEAIRLRDRYSKNVGTILVAFNDEQLMAAMADDRVDFIIPFHRSQWKKSQYAAMGLPAKTKDYTFMQNEKFIKPQYHEYRGRMVKDKAINYMPNEYWDFSKSGKENAEAYLEMCARNNKRPKFYKLLQNNGDGSYSLKADGSTDGYWKLLIDFKMYDNEGNGSPQMPVRPDFNMKEATRMLSDYRGGHSSFPVAQGIVDEFVEEYKQKHEGRQFSDRKNNSDGSKQTEQKTVLEDKYYSRQIDKWDGKDHGGSFRVGKVSEPLLKIGIPDVDIWFDQSKAARQLDGKKEVTKGVLKKIPYLLEHPIAISESYDNTVMVFGEVYDSDGNPVVVALRVNSTNRRNHITLVNKIRSVGTRTHNLDKLLNEDAILYLGENKKETNRWFNALGRSTPFGGTKFGLIKSISFEVEKSNIISNKTRSNSAIQRQDRSERTSNRSLLANAFGDMAQSDAEREWIQKYRARVDHLDELEQKLQRLRSEIREASFSEGKRDTEKLERLRVDAAEVARQIDLYDKRLLRLESAKPLQDVLEREKKAAYQKASAKHQESRKKAMDNRHRSEEKQKIRIMFRELDRILNRGNKKRNVKEGMQEFAASAIASAELLFSDYIADEDLIRNGIGTEMISKEQETLSKAQDLMEQIGRMSGYDSLKQREKLEQKLKGYLKELNPVFVRERARLNKAGADRVFGDLIRAYEELKESPYSHIQMAYDDGTLALLKSLQADVGSSPVKDMNLAQLEALHKVLTVVTNKIRTANKAFADGKTMEQTVTQAAEEIRQRKIPDKKMLIAIRNLENKTGWDYEKPVYALKRIGSDAITKLFLNLMDSENTAMADVDECKTFLDQMVEKYGYNDWTVDRKLDRTFVDSTGKKFRMTTGELMSLYAYARRGDGMRHIETGGFTMEHKALTDADAAIAYKLSPDMVNAITDLLTAEQKEFVEEMQTFLSETMGAKGNEVSMKLYGIKLFGEKNYFPIHMSGAYKQNVQEAQAKQAQGFGTLSNAGFTKAQNKNATGVVVMEPFLEVWADHCNEMSRYHATVPALEDIRRVMNYSRTMDSTTDSMSLKALIENRYGKEAVQYLDNLYREANSGPVQDKLQTRGQKALGMFRKNAVAYSSSVLIQQPAAITRAYAMIPKKYFGGLRGIGGLPVGIGKTALDRWGHWQTKAYEEMRRYAPGVTIAKEIGGFDTASGSTIRSYLLDTGKNLRQSVKTEGAKGLAKGTMKLVDDNAVANLPNLMDKIAWIEIWNACKRETAEKRKDLEQGSEAFLEAAGQRFTDVIRSTQVYDSVFAKSPLLRSKNVWVQSAVSFMNEPNTAANMMEQAVRDAARGDWTQAGRTFSAVARCVIFTGVLKAVVYALRDDEEDETFLEKYLAELAGSLVADVNPVNYIPFARDVWSVAQGYGADRTDMAIFSDILTPLNKWIELREEDRKDLDEAELEELDQRTTEALWKTLETGATLIRVPVKNIRREIDMVLRVVDAVWHRQEKKSGTALSIRDKVEEAMAEAMPAFLRPEGKSKGDKLYYAILEGDAVYEERLRKRYEDPKIEDEELRQALADKKADTAIRKALRERDPRIRQAAESYVRGDLKEYEALAKEVIDEGFFSQNLVRDAIRAEAEEIVDKDPEMPSGKEKGLFTGDDFTAAVLAGDYYMAKRVRDDLIETAKKNGSSAQDAEKNFQSTARSGCKELYLTGQLSDSKAKSLLETYGGKTAEEAQKTVQYWKFSMKYPKYDLNEAAVSKYYNKIEKSGISVAQYAEFLEKLPDQANREETLAVINSMKLTRAQKDALYRAAGYAESRLSEAPWY